MDAAVEKMNEEGTFPDYNVIQSMEYLDMVFHETLRLHPAIGTLQRAPIKDYNIPGMVEKFQFQCLTIT